MSKAATATVKLAANVTYSDTDNLGVTYTGNPGINFSQSLSNSNINKVYSGSATISTAASVDFTSATDIFGGSLNFATVKGIYLQNNSANQTVVVGGGTHALIGSDQYTVGAGQAILITSPWTVTSGTAQQLTLTPSGSLNYTLIAVGS